MHETSSIIQNTTDEFHRLTIITDSPKVDCQTSF